jgi:hypothetical protein
MTAKPRNPENNTQELLHRIREEVAKRKAAFCVYDNMNDVASKSADLRARDASAETPPPFRLKLPEFAPFAVQPVFKPKADKRYHVNDLLCYHGQTFVKAAYQALLLRSPDRGGFDNYLKLLRNGCSKIDILGRLRYSKEGKAAGVDITGLRMPFLLRQVCRIPVIGRFVEVLAAIWRLPHFERQQQLVETRTILLMEQAQHHLHETFSALNQSFVQIEEAIRLLQEVAGGTDGKNGRN